MNRDDDKIRRAFDRRVSKQPSPRTGWADVEAGIRRSRARRVAGGSVVSLALVVAAAIIVPKLSVGHRQIPPANSNVVATFKPPFDLPYKFRGSPSGVKVIPGPCRVEEGNVPSYNSDTRTGLIEFGRSIQVTTCDERKGSASTPVGIRLGNLPEAMIGQPGIVRLEFEVDRQRSTASGVGAVTGNASVDGRVTNTSWGNGPTESSGYSRWNDARSISASFPLVGFECTMGRCVPTANGGDTQTVTIHADYLGSPLDVEFFAHAAAEGSGSLTTAFSGRLIRVTVERGYNKDAPVCEYSSGSGNPTPCPVPTATPNPYWNTDDCPDPQWQRAWPHPVSVTALPSPCGPAANGSDRYEWAFPCTPAQLKYPTGRGTYTQASGYPGTCYEPPSDLRNDQIVFHHWFEVRK